VLGSISKFLPATMPPGRPHALPQQSGIRAAERHSGRATDRPAKILKCSLRNYKLNCLHENIDSWLLMRIVIYLYFDAIFFLSFNLLYSEKFSLKTNQWSWLRICSFSLLITDITDIAHLQLWLLLWHRIICSIFINIFEKQLVNLDKLTWVYQWRLSFCC
jgi:hypothetical protein